jgi:uncharacterized RDD family membrane protein YckC
MRRPAGRRATLGVEVQPTDDQEATTAVRADDRGGGLTGAAGRAAFFPARAAARMWRDEIEGAVEAALTSPEVVRAIDRALAGPLPEEVARSIVRHRVVERMAAELARSGELDRLLGEAIASRHALHATDRLLESPEMRHALAAVAANPEIDAAIARRTRGLADQLVDGMRAAAVRMDSRTDGAAHGRRAGERSAYAGLATRALAMAIDVIAASALYMSVVGVAALVAELVGGLRPAWLVGALLSVGWTAVGGGYLVLFWSAVGQTPGMRLAGLRVQTAAGQEPSVGRSLVRLGGLLLAIVPLFAGFLPILFDARRRGLADLLARTVVVYDPAPEPADEAPR